MEEAKCKCLTSIRSCSDSNFSQQQWKCASWYVTIKEQEDKAWGEFYLSKSLCSMHCYIDYLEILALLQFSSVLQGIVGRALKISHDPLQPLIGLVPTCNCVIDVWLSTHDCTQHAFDCSQIYNLSHWSLSSGVLWHIFMLKGRAMTIGVSNGLQLLISNISTFV